MHDWLNIMETGHFIYFLLSICLFIAALCRQTLNVLENFDFYGGLSVVNLINESHFNFKCNIQGSVGLPIEANGMWQICVAMRQYHTIDGKKQGCQI